MDDNDVLRCTGHPGWSLRAVGRLKVPVVDHPPAPPQLGREAGGAVTGPGIAEATADSHPSVSHTRLLALHLHGQTHGRVAHGARGARRRDRGTVWSREAVEKWAAATGREIVKGA